MRLKKPRRENSAVLFAALGALAQLGERRLCKAEVIGSIPIRSIIVIVIVVVVFPVLRAQSAQKGETA